MDLQDPREGRLPAAVAILAALVCFVILAGVGLAKCSVPPPAPIAIPRPDPTPAAKAIASSSAAATMTNDLEIIIPRSPTPKAIALKQPNEADQRVITTPETDHPEEPIVIRIRQSATATASSEASSSATAPGQPLRIPEEFGHARLGVALLTAPGILMADYQLVRLDASPLSRPVIGVDLELGLDVAGNAQVGAVGVTAGGKAFAGAWAWSRWDLGAQGIAAGIGLRF
jgi:hypothetical protein